MKGHVTGLKYHTLTQKDYEFSDLDREPDAKCQIPGVIAGEGKAHEMQVWWDHGMNRTFMFCAGEFINQEPVFVNSIITLKNALDDYMAECEEYR